MADIIIPDVRDHMIAAVDVKAQRLGLSRDSYLRRVLARERNIQSSEVSVASLASFAKAFADLDDRDVMNHAWR